MTFVGRFCRIGRVEGFAICSTNCLYKPGKVRAREHWGLSLTFAISAGSKAASTDS